jgi:predicted metal-dependent enzyme (double-stranded beta helix superfamily)
VPATERSARALRAAGFARPEGTALRLFRPHLSYGVTDLIEGVDRAIRETPKSRVVDAVSRELAKLLDNPQAIDDSLILEREDRYSRTLLHSDPEGRFTILLLAWRPGQASPIHDHDCWGAVGVYRGAISETSYALADGELRRGTTKTARKGQVTAVNPPESDLHKMENRHRGMTVTIHVYGRDMKEANVYDAGTGAAKRSAMVFDRVV